MDLAGSHVVDTFWTDKNGKLFDRDKRKKLSEFFFKKKKGVGQDFIQK